MSKRTKDYLRWNITFAKHNDEEMQLLEWLKTLEHGSFATLTKEFWMKRMKESEKK